MTDASTPEGAAPVTGGSAAQSSASAASAATATTAPSPTQNSQIASHQTARAAPLRTAARGLPAVGSASLRYRFFALVVGIFALAAAAAWYAFDRSTDTISRELGVRFAEREVLYERERIRAPLDREVALVSRLAASDTLLDWLQDEDNPTLRAAALRELEGFRQIFQDRSYFLINDHSLHYYFNDRAGQFTGHELRYTLHAGAASDAWYFPLHSLQAPYELNVDYDIGVDQTKVWINMPVRRGGKMLGLVGTGFDLSEFIRRFLNTRTRGVTNILVNRTGAIQAHAEQRRIALDTGGGAAAMAQSSIYGMVDSDAAREHLRDAFALAQRNPDTVRTLFVSQQGRQRLLGIAYLPQIDWFVVTEMDLKQLIGLAPFQTIPIIGGLALLISLGLVSWALQRLVLSRVARLDVATQRMAEGDYALRLHDTRDDELGRLSGNFERLAQTVQDSLTHLEARVDERTQALSAANHTLGAQREEIFASLRYARSIQSATLPSNAHLSACLGEHLLLWWPREHVSGDFYFVFDAADGFYAGVADCTGHGVPGALTSLVGYGIVRSVLLDAAARPEAPRPLSALLAQIDQALREALGGNQGEVGFDSGMAFGLVRVGDSRNALAAGTTAAAGSLERAPTASPDSDVRVDVEFCGRGIDLYRLAPGAGQEHDDGSAPGTEANSANAALGSASRAGPGAPASVAAHVECFNGQRGGLGYRLRRKAGELITHRFTAAAADAIYLASDGLFDHAGGNQGFGFGRARFVAFLRASQGLRQQALGEALAAALQAYAGLHVQRDDLTVLGFYPAAAAARRRDANKH
ncbi:MAG: SpoIIE family protein phosphatase [Janthinobacterium lividum]